MEEKTIRKIDFAIIGGTIVVLALMMNYAMPLVIAPVDNMETINTSILFSFEKANLILIDDNPQFTSAEKIYAKDNLVINLKPGVYYWKVEGIGRSEIRKLTIISEINLKLKSINGGYEVVNAGNVELNVDVYENESLKEKLTLNRDESKNVSGTKFIGRENE